MTDAPPDLLIRNARAFTVDAARPWAEAIAVREGRIAWVGDDADASEGPDTEVIDAAGATVLPGFIDTHNHARLGSNPLEVDLAGAGSLDEVKARVRAHADAHPEHTWIEGVGFNYSAMPDGRMPTAQDLDGLTGGRPAFLLTYDAHNAWLNREAMDVFAITRDTDTLPWGHVRKDPVTGEPTGIVGDFAVMGISRAGQAALEPVLPGYERELQYERTLESLDMATRFGITTILEPQNSPEDLWVFERARDEGRLRSRLIAAMFHPVGTTEAELQGFDAARRRLGDDDRLRVGPIKLYIDDVIEPWTAAMLEPYANRPEERGDTFWTPREFADLVTDLERRGWSCHVHGTGDRGLRVALDGFEAARLANGDVGATARHGPHRVPPRRRRAPFRRARRRPDHATAPLRAFDHRGLAGERRSRPLASCLGVPFPARDGREAVVLQRLERRRDGPLVGIYSAITRADLDGTGGWIPEETLDLETTLAAYTMGGAHVVFAEDRRGSITPGKQADLAVLSGDLFEAADADPRRILDLHVTHTVVDGEVVHRA